MATNGDFMDAAQLSDRFGPGKMDGRGLVAHYNQAFIMEDEEVPMELPNGILEASEVRGKTRSETILIITFSKKITRNDALGTFTSLALG